jgi:hypothetical protein
MREPSARNAGDEPVFTTCTCTVCLEMWGIPVEHPDAERQGWDDIVSEAVDCPACDAQVDEPCTGPGRQNGFHQVRFHIAYAVHLYRVSDRAEAEYGEGVTLVRPVSGRGLRLA